MTRMSEPHVPQSARIRANPPEPHGGSRLAHPVHDYRPPVFSRVLLLSIGLGSYIFQPQLEVDNQDAGVNSPPAILAVRADDSTLPEPGTVVFNRGQCLFNVELIDT